MTVKLYQPCRAVAKKAERGSYTSATGTIKKIIKKKMSAILENAFRLSTAIPHFGQASFLSNTSV